MYDLKRANRVFDAINHIKKNAEANSPEDFDFFLTAGDNLYPFYPRKPQDFEFERMMALFNNRDAIKHIPIMPVRGNHDCYFKKEDAEIELSSKHTNWNFNEFYYQSQFEVGPKNEKMSIMHLDSCYLLCSTVGLQIKEGLVDRDSLDEHSKLVYDNKC